jgi:hypothetical protein
MQVTLEHEAETVKIQVVEVVVKRILAATGVNAVESELAYGTRTSPVRFPKTRVTKMQ